MGQPHPDHGTEKTPPPSGAPSSAGRNSAFSIAPAIVVLLAAVAATFYLRSAQKPFELKPSNLPKVTESTLFNASYREDMYWGTYRPGFYAGIRQRSELPLMAGLMWGSPYKASSRVIRHEASKDHGLNTFGWRRHDLRSYGEQHIRDGPVGISTQWLKQPGRGYGGDWLLTLNVTRDDSGNPNTLVRNLPVFLYLGQTSPDDTLTGDATFEAEPGVDIGELMSGSGAMFASGTHPEMGKWVSAVRVVKDEDSGAARSGSVSMTSAKSAAQHKVHDIAQASMDRRRQSMPADDDCGGCMMQEFPVDGNLAILQVNFQPPFSMDIAFASGLGGHNTVSRAAMQMSKLMGPRRGEVLDSKVAEFDRRFADMTSGKLGEDVTEMCESAVAEVVGSVGYFHGSSIVQLPSGDRVLSQPQPLFTAVPSRGFFPRGFLWDEGFHQLLLQQWDLQASCDMLAHWLDLTNADGWIPREQILGEEARSRVPQEFMAQHPSVANPPTLFLPLMKVALAVSGDASAAGLLQDPHTAVIAREHWVDFLHRAWPRLKLWLSWLDFQAGAVPSSYRWRGREDNGRLLNPLTLASGLDDFPRASHPSTRERHVDLRSWMAFSYRSMITIGQALGKPDTELAPLRAKAKPLLDYATLKALHWDSAAGAFLDWGDHTEDVALRRVQLEPQTEPAVLRLMVGSAPQPQFVPHIGYNSLFPLALELIPWDSPDVASQLALLADPMHLWSDFGLRSLSKASSLYGRHNSKDNAPYWRGSVWINVNFLVLRSLDACHRGGGRNAAQCYKLYARLRSNVLGNMGRQFHSPENQFIWESYSDVDGSGRGTHPMGWSSMIALIALERY